MYKNQADIDRENAFLASIDPDWKIGSYGIGENDVAISIGIMVPIKGNAAKIRKLEEAGWEKTFRVRREFNVFGQKDGNIMYQRLNKRLYD